VKLKKGVPIVNSPSSERLSLQRQLEEVKQEFLRLLEAVPDQVWDSRFKGERWNIKQEMAHLVQVVKVISGGLKNASTGIKHSTLSFVPAGIRSWFNGYLVIPIKARNTTRESIAFDYKQAHNELISVISELSEKDWNKRYPFPRKYRTVAQIVTRPIEHFVEHKAHIQRLLEIKTVEWR